jgi:hypothetical protein
MPRSTGPQAAAPSALSNCLLCTVVPFKSYDCSHDPGGIGKAEGLAVAPLQHAEPIGKLRLPLPPGRIFALNT